MKKLIFTDNDQGGIIQIANIKGGVGKSTIATNLAACFAQRGPTLIIDLDVQGCATAAFGKEPSSFKKSSYNLFKNRYYLTETMAPARTARTLQGRIRNTLRKAFFGRESITDLTVNIMPGLDLIPANSSLFAKIGRKQIRNFLFSLKVCREYYKYIIIDTASVWDETVKNIFIAADLNLIPVTLNALSTKSLKEYANEIAKLMHRNPDVNVRIVKNEVYGLNSKQNTGKTRTMNENRAFLHSLFESFSKVPENGAFTIPRSIVLNLEIPEASLIRSAQDNGLSLTQLKYTGPLKRSFEQLTDAVQFVLNRIRSSRSSTGSLRHEFNAYARALARAAVFLMAALFPLSTFEDRVPPVRTPSQLERTPITPIVYSYQNRESLYQIAKYAVSEYRALLVAHSELERYVAELMQIHNLTARERKQPLIRNYWDISPGTEIVLYPPSFMRNRNYLVDRRVFGYYKSMVKDDFAYITGLWANRGIGGGTPHEGVDIACKLGTVIVAPTDGVAFLENNARGGNQVIVRKDDFSLLFAHMDRRYVQNNERVVKGQPLGTVGMTGATTGPHLHFGYGIRTPGFFGRYDYIDPANWVYRMNFVQKNAQSAPATN